MISGKTYKETLIIKFSELEKLLDENGYTQEDKKLFSNYGHPFSTELAEMIRERKPIKEVYAHFLKDTRYFFPWAGEKDPDCDY